MKHTDLLRHLENYGCELLREGSRHTVYVNRLAQDPETFIFHQSITQTLCLVFTHSLPQ
jgi:mRNA interferase HicA